MEGTRGLLALFILAACFLVNGAQKTVCTEEAVADIVFLVDGSWSIGTENFEQIRQFLSTLVNSFEVGADHVRIGLVQYSNNPETEFLLNSFQTKQDVLQSISNLPYRGGGTKTGLGLDFMLKNHFTNQAGSRANEGVPQIAVVITDGQSQDNVEPHAQDLKRQGITLYAIGIKDADEIQLREIASEPLKQHVYSVSDFAALQGISQSIVQVLCTTVEEAKRQVTLVAEDCRTVADIVFVVDGSSSIGTENFQEVREFLHKFIDRLEIGEQNVRVGLIQYSDEPHQEFLLAEHMDKKSLLEEVDHLPYRTGGTYTGKALTFLQTHYFNKTARRPTDDRVPQIAVVITDGDSSDEVMAPAQLLRQQGAIVFAIGVGQTNNVELEAIANRPHERFLVNINNYQALQRLSRPDGLLLTVCESMKDQRQALAATFADVFFLLDSSMVQGDFQQVRNLLIRLGTQMTLGAEANRFGLAQFGRTVKVEFLLNAHSTKEATKEALRRFRLRPNGPRNLGNAMEFASKQFFNAAAGGRADQGARQFLVVVTGGDSNDDVIIPSRLVKAEGVKVMEIDVGTATIQQMATPRMPAPPHVNQGANTLGSVPSLRTAFETEEEAITLSEDCKSAKLADIVFIVDESGSIGTANFQLIRTFLRDIVDGLDVGLNKVRVAILLYSDRATAQVYLNSFNNKNEILQFIKILPYRGGGTNTGAALQFAKENIFIKKKGSRSDQNIEQVAVVITDGESQDNVTTAAAELRRSGVKIYAVGIKNANETELRQIASYPYQKHVFIVDGFTKLKSLKQNLQKSMCYNIIGSAVSVIAREDTIKQGCMETEEADIFFLIDQSGSIFPEDFKDMKKFIIEFLQSFSIGPQNVRVGVAKYADRAELEFDLTKYTDIKSLEKAVERIGQEGGGTKTGLALDFMGPHFEKAASSRHAKVREYLIVITDGKSTDRVMEPALKLRDKGITIYTIGVKNANMTELTEIAGSPEKRFFVNDFDGLGLIKDDIITDICSTDACKDASGDLFFLIDSSGSINSEDFQKMKEFMKSVIRKSLIGRDKVHVGVMQFSIKQRVEFPLNQLYDKASMEDAIDSMKQMKGGTLTGAAISEISQYFDPPRGGRTNMKRFLIVVTDGEAQDDVKEPSEALRNKGVVIYAIGVVNANNTQLLEISGSRKRLYSERDFDGLKSLENKLALSLCDVEEECIKTEIADIVFLVDGSTSITLEDFRSMKTFMVSVVNKTTVGEKLTRFGVILFSTKVEPQFNLNTYFSKREIRSAIMDLKLPYGDTYTGKALNHAVEYFDPAHGGRRASKVPQILMVITDGEATDPSNLPGPSLKLKNNGISVLAIGVKGADKKELEIMTAGDKSKVFFVDNFKALETLQTNMSTVLCTSVKPVVCEKQKADLVMLIDDSRSIYEANFTIMTNFMADLASNFSINRDYVHVGAAQFSNNLQDVFYLNQFHSEAEVREQIIGIKHRYGDETNIGAALRSIRKYFLEENGSRVKSGVPQNLVLITDGESSDHVGEEADFLRSMNISVFIIGIGKVNPMELQHLAGSKNRVFPVDDFVSLGKVMNKVLKEICKDPQDTPVPFIGCSIDIGIGFDNTQRTGSHGLLDGQPKLQAYLPDIVRYVSTLEGLCCVTTDPVVKAKIGFRVLSHDGTSERLDDWNFEEYNEDIVKKVMALQITGPTYFNSALLNSFTKMFQTDSKGGVKVLVIFTDGLDEDVQTMQQASKLLQLNGVHALLTVALEGVQDAQSLKTVEFGRGFGYKHPLSIGMQSVGTTMRTQLDTVAERECCKVMCKCSGPEGIRGQSGQPGPKGLPGPEGHPGFPGEEGGIGERGPAGTTGPHGLQGCPGTRGQKGSRGYRGNRGDDGEHGLDGINGEQGVTGMAGGPGERGDLGNPGSPGLRGEPGENGRPGLRGDPGETGRDNEERGPPGERGQPGLPGDAGEDGVPGGSGVDGNTGPQGRRGPPGPKGPSGEAGEDGARGIQGPSGPQGKIGETGHPGPKGPAGLPGPQGQPGTEGGKGSAGRLGPNGRKGEPGDLGVKGVAGPLGPRGIPGLDGRDGYGVPGPKGLKGEPGFPGYPGRQGESGFTGGKGGPGPKGNHGRGGNAGGKGATGDLGTTGRPGYRGARGSPGPRAKSECELITYIRDNCACSQGRAECPTYPTELVFGLDMSRDVKDQDFEIMRSTLVSLLNGISIAESNCPTGARVAVVAYSNYTKYLIRFQDYQNKAKLIEAVENIALEKRDSPPLLGAAMRYVGHNVFKRVRQGMMMRKVAIFLSSKPSEDSSTIVTAAMEYKALGIAPAVISLHADPYVQKAFEADDTGSFILTTLDQSQDQETQLRTVKHCVICYDPCSPLEECPSAREGQLPQTVDMDLALVVDGSRGVQADQYAGVQQLLGSVVEQLAVSPEPGQGDRQARVALLQSTGSQYAEAQSPPTKVEFGFQRYQNHTMMQRHLLQGMQQQGGSCALGQTLDFTLREVLLKAAEPRRSKVVLAVVGDETASWDRAKLHYVSQEAKCQGVVLFVITVGDAYNRTQVEELASSPVEQHLLHMGQMKAEEQGYTQRFFRAFLAILNSQGGERVYLPPTLKQTCEQLDKQRPVQDQGQDQGQGQVHVYSLVEEEGLEEHGNQQQEVFLEHTGVHQSKPGGRGQEDVSDSLTRGDGHRPSRTKLRAQCLLDMDMGSSCRDHVVQWYYKASIHACSPFWYGGCDGNSNRFSTESECFQTCGSFNSSSLLRTDGAKATDKSVCSLKQDVGTCHNYAVVWYFDSAQRECSRFWFGGCGGNGNRFKTLEECEALCLTRKR